jgi:hypothetical protein
MSAFIVDSKTIDRVVSFIIANRQEFFSVSTRDGGNAAYRIGRLLLALNTQAVNHRYTSEHWKVPEYEFKRVAVTDMQAYKSIGCLLYQCSEGDVPNDPDFIELSKLHDDLAHRIVTKLPAYDKAEWG